MEYLMIEPSTDFGTIEKEKLYIFFSGSQRQFFQIKQNSFTKFLVDNISHGIYLADLEKEAQKQHIDFGRLAAYVGFLLQKKLIVVKEVDPEYDQSKFSIPELWRSPRYGYQILYLKERYKKFLKNKSDAEIQSLLADFTITIVGMGSPGSMLAIWFAAMGVGKINLIDGDNVELSNLMRQFFYMESDIGRKKTDCIKNYIERFNSKVNVESIPEFVTEDNKINIFPKSDLIIQTADKPAGLIDLYINEASIKLNIPTIYMHNQSIGPFVVPNRTKSMKDFYDIYNNKTKGMFYKEINNMDPRSVTSYPTIVHGVVPITSRLFDFIVEYIVTKELPILENSIWYENENKFESF
ncbi:hypothetical protein IV44_GL000306 [Lactobacillus amylovorus DSM 16698]|uniref:THIF-type NAD/FAD binding fold domain-containing protein n=1 Tax=Lactobacillus amylovorus subsp. animalium DSM 16698 TaxID=695563 RepID=A0A0R2KRV1_LACAM|nr:ThiF family adenylyltransferase [Lactobacillus amylovorus]KRN92176.1 hypothetical protein IV44_GL000306 [Lactobacillus amylovorus DSM 16698]